MSDAECDLMLDALQMHLETIRSRLVSLTEHFQSQTDIPTLHPSPPPHTRPLAPPTTNEPSQILTSTSAKETLPHPAVRMKGGPSHSETISLPDTEVPLRSAGRGYKPLSEQLSDWKPLHEYYKHLHLEALQRHVKGQLEVQRRTDRRWEESCRRRERRERRVRLAQKPRAFRSQLKNDNAFLQRVHTSIFYKIVEVECKMRKQGLLRSKVDHETFWSTMLVGDRNKILSPPTLPPFVPASVSPVREEESELTNTWAITGLQETGPHLPPLDSSPPPPCWTEDILSEIERAVEANRPPKLHSLTNLLAPDSFRVEERSQVSNSAVLEVRSTRDQMHTMLAHSKRHELEAQRFMERSDFVDFSALFSNFCAQLEQLPRTPIPRAKKVSPTADSSKSLPSLPLPLPPPKQTPLPQATQALDDIKEESASSLSPPATVLTKSDPSPDTRPEAVPLCLGEVVSCSLAVKGPMGKSTLWNPLLSID